MRYVTYVITPGQGYFDVGERVMRANGVVPRAIHQLDWLTDDTVVVQLAVDGDVGAVERCFDRSLDRVIDYQVTTVSDDVVVQFHTEPGELVRALLDVHRSQAVVHDFPLEYVGPERTRLRVSEVGHEDALRELVAAMRERIDVEIESVGTYVPSIDRAFASLTGRQREVLATAVESGYYEVPRRVTYEDIASHLGCSAGAVGQHLRRVEARIMREFVGDAEVAVATD